MKVTLTIEIDHSLLPEIANLLGKEIAEKEPVKTATKRTRKAEDLTIEPAPAKPEELAELPLFKNADPPTAEPAAYDLSSVKQAVATQLKAGNQAKVKTLLVKFGAKNISGLLPEQYADFMKDLEEINA